MQVLFDELRTLDTRPPALRRFGWLVGAVLTVVALALAWWATSGSITDRLAVLPGALAGRPSATVLLAVGIALATLGLARPSLLRLPYVAWMGVALALGFVMTRVILTVVFFGIITPIGLFRRMLGHDPMHRSPDQTTPSFWIRRTPPADVKASLEKYW